VINIHSKTSFEGEVKLSATCRKILWHVKDPLRYDKDTERQNSAAISHPVSPTLLISVSAATRAENSGGRIGNDYNSDRVHNKSENGHSCMGCFVQHHPITVTSNIFEAENKEIK
jgi:hypothetical protein